MIDVHPRHAELIAASLDRRLSTAERSEVQEHLSRCAACRALEQNLRADATALSVPVRIAPPKRIQLEIERQTAIPPVDPSLVRVLRIAVAATLLLVVIVVLAIGIALLQPRPTTPMETREPQPAGLRLPESSW